MSIRKEYSQNKNKCKVTFILSKDISESFGSICVVGDFNQWDQHANIFSGKETDGSFSAKIVLESSNTYQFRYLADGIHWFNDSDADGEIESYFKGSKNSVIVI